MTWLPNRLGFDSVSNAGGTQKISICHLSSHLMNTLIVGTVIAKQDLRSFPNKKKPGTERFVLNFTIRDSPDDTINASCWGEEEAVKNMYNSFEIGDVVQIKNSQIQTRQTDGSDERFRPKVSSLYHLNISTTHSSVTCFDGPTSKFSSLIHYPLKSANDYFTLTDIICGGQNADEQQINLLVAVRSISTPQEINTKDGRHVKKLELKVFDQTHPLFSVLIWDEATMVLAQRLVPRKSVLFISDIRVSYNRYLKGMAATANSCTIFTPDPEIPDAQALYHYAQTANFNVENSDQNILEFSEATSLYTVEELYHICQSTNSLVNGDIEGSIFAFITKLDLDGYSKLISTRCHCCKQVQVMPGQCENVNCAVGAGFEITEPEEEFDLNIWLSDHTGTLKRCLLSGSVAQKLLNCTTEQFMCLTDDEKTHLKWQCLFEKFRVKFKVSQSSESYSPFMRVLSISAASLEEIVSNNESENIVLEE